MLSLSGGVRHSHRQISGIAGAIVRAAAPAQLWCGKAVKRAKWIPRKWTNALWGWWWPLVWDSNPARQAALGGGLANTVGAMTSTRFAVQDEGRGFGDAGHPDRQR